METVQTSSPRYTGTVPAEIHRSTGVTLDAEQQELATAVTNVLDDVFTSGTTSAGQLTGFFVHGPPGRGKTWLATQLFESAPCPRTTKRHVHFHDFFRTLQQQLGPKVSTRKAIDMTLTEMLTGTELFFFDELHVHDPGSAALLNNLLAEITERGIPTLITSNYEPEGLLPDVMVHHVIEPSIKLLREHFDIRFLDAGTDYRSHVANSASGFASGCWITTEPGQSTTEALQCAELIPCDPHETTTVLEGHRALQASAIRGTQIWFDFADLLDVRSTTQDYLELADQYDAWVLLNVPRLSHASPAAQQRFVSLMDVLVERDLPLTVLADAPCDETLDVADEVPDLFRTRSRLQLLS